MISGRKRRHGLFEAYGFAWGCCAVDRNSMEVLPALPDPLRTEVATDQEAIKRDILLSSSFSGHTLTLLNGRSVRKPAKWGRKVLLRTAAFAPWLHDHNALFMGGGAHPFLSPANVRAGAAWSPEQRAALARLTDPLAHAWTNDQAFRLDLRFETPSEFAKLHAAVRVLLPVLPALTAASPVLEGRDAGYQSARLQARLSAFDRAPALIGPFVPEAVFDQESHDREVLVPIARAAASSDRQQGLDPLALNARAATVDFERGVLTIHAVDGQESPSTNMAVAEFIIAVLKALVSGRWVSTYLQRAWSAEDLRAILLDTIRDGDSATLSSGDHLLMFGLMKQGEMPALKLWQHLFVELYSDLSDNARQHIGTILEHGTLATRLRNRIGSSFEQDAIRTAYRGMAECFAADRAFV